MLTAYDYTTAKLEDEAGVDSILVGDSLGMVIMGYDSTLSVTMEDMIHHSKIDCKRCKKCTCCRRYALYELPDLRL